MPVQLFQEPDLSPMGLYSRGPDYGCCRRPGAPQSLFNQLVGDLQSRLDEMEKMRVWLVDASPLLSLGEDGQESKARLRGKRQARTPSSPRTNTHQFSLEVSGFSPEELTVKTEGRKLTVFGKQEKKTESEDGCCSHEYREVRREVLLPEDANLEAVACALSQDGHLRIEAPRLALAPPEERTIPIPIGKLAGEDGQGAVPEDEHKKENGGGCERREEGAEAPEKDYATPGLK